MAVSHDSVFIGMEMIIVIGKVILKSVLTKAYAQLDKGELDSFVKNWRDDGIFIAPGNSEESGEYKGIEVITEFFRMFMASFPKRHFEIKQICIQNPPLLSKYNTVAVIMDVHLTNRFGSSYVYSKVSIIEMKWLKAYKATDYHMDSAAFEKMWRE